MDWKELLAKFRLVDMKAEGKQVGGINVNVEDNSDKRIYNFNFYGVEAVDKFVAGKFKINEEFEKRVKEEAERRLINLGISPDSLSEGARTEIGSLTVGASAVDAITIRDEDKLKEENLTRVFQKSKPKK